MISFFVNFRRKIIFSRKEKIHFLNQLSFLLEGGVSIFESLEIIEHQVSGKIKKEIISDLKKDVSNGLKFSDSLGKNLFFDEFSINLIKSGETGGFLKQNINYLVNQLKRRQEIMKGFYGAMFYPLFIALAATALVATLIFYIFPKILPIILSLNINLPLSTRIIINTAEFLIAYGLVLFLSVLVLIFIFVVSFKKLTSFRFVVHKFLFKFRLWGSVYKDFVLSDFCRTLGMLLESGLPIDRALAVVEKTNGNLFLKKNIVELRKSVAKGFPIHLFLEQNKSTFPEQMSQMIAVGERAGSLSHSLVHLSQFYESEFSEKLKIYSRIIEPVLMITAGLAVGLVAVSIISPIYEITQNLQSH